MLKVSVITVCFNSVDSIRDTIRSVASQTYPNIEYIIIDGDSVDGTKEVIKQHKDRVTTFVSEPDDGIYYAMNKGMSFATGDIIAFLNADDFYSTDNVLEKIVEAFNDPQIDAVYGDICYVRKLNPSQIVRYWKSKPFVPKSCAKGWIPPHPTFVARRTVYERFGGYCLDYRLASDFELIMRFMEVCKIRVHYVADVLVMMRLGGTTNKSLKNIWLQNKEVLRALRNHGLSVNPIQYFYYKLIARGKQFFQSPLG